MAYRNYHEAYQDFRDNVLEGIRSHFPIQSKNRVLELEALEVEDGKLSTEDLRSQKEAKLQGQTWAAPVYAKLALKDETGKVIDSRRMRVAEIPKMTARYSYIVDGQEYQVDSQWQLKPGVYARRTNRDELQAQFNTPNKGAFQVTFHPEKKLFLMNRRKSNAIPVYPLMKALGVSDEQLEKSWGKEVLLANQAVRGANTALEKFYRADRKNPPPSPEAALEYFTQTMKEAQLRPDATKYTLGKPIDHVNGEALERATKKLMQIQAGAPEDDRDSLLFKDLRTTAEYAFDKLTDRSTVSTVRAKALRKINSAQSVRDVIKFDMFNDPVRRTFSDNSAARVAEQVNPLEMIAAASQTTVTGPGGIQKDHQITNEVKFINPSHLGFLDPIRTPEGPKTGVTLRLPMAVKKVGKEPRIPLYNLRTGKYEHVPPATFYDSNVVMPDQVEWKDGKPVPVASKVKVSTAGNKFNDLDFKKADYVMRHSSDMFNLTSNLIPFLSSTSGNRATYAGQHLEQSISLLKREPPLVQISTGAKKAGLSTFEELLGRQAGHTAPTDGRVVAVKKDAVIIQSKDGKKHEVQLYDNFPLNDPKSVLDSEPRVKVGDKVRRGEVVADTNFSKDGKLALGTNLRVAYIPFKGYNFEDGVVISESAAKKLSSVHMHKPAMTLGDDFVIDRKKFGVYHPEAFTKDQYTKLDEKGVVQVGQTVMPGDPLVLAMRPFQAKDRMSRSAVRRTLSGQHTDVSMRWDSDYPGKVVGVHRKGNEVIVHVKTTEPMQIGDKIAGRVGNKGIVTRVLPDSEMPRTKDGNPIEVALNPSGVPGRMNASQVFETAAAKIALKTGKPYVVESFDHHNVLDKVKKDLKKHGLSDTEELIDPTTGMPLGKALVGPQHMLKLMHQVDKKISARAGMAGAENVAEPYDMNLVPGGGGKAAGQRVGQLGMNVLLAHGAVANIREMQTWKSEGPDSRSDESKQWPSQHRTVWAAIQTGDPLPAPKPTFSFYKFQQLLKAAGINMEKKGHELQLMPLTDKEILKMSAGEIPNPKALTHTKLDHNGEPKPKTGGLFDPKLTGGHGGNKWTHIKLAEPLPNPVYEGAIQKLLGLPKKDYQALVAGDKALTRSGRIVDVDTPNTVTGGLAIKQMLEKINVPKALAEAEKQLAETKLPASFPHKGSTQKIDTLVKKVKYLRALDNLNMKPSEAYVLNHLPVIPPALRPASVLPSGDVRWGDLNGLYSEFAQVNETLATLNKGAVLPDARKKNLRADIYDGLKAITGAGVPYGDKTQNRGILLQIHGSQPKKGYFQRTLLNRRQDLSMRSVITPEPALGLDEVGLPKDKALTVFKPFVVKKLVDMGAAPSPLDAQELVAKKSPYAFRALELVAQERPVMIKRDPALHKHSIQAFQARLVPGRAIQIHPLVTGGFNADFDGDTMSVYVPITTDAVEEAKKMMPSHNLFNEATGKVMYQPSLESALGLYKLSRVQGDGKKKFNKEVDALRAVQQGKLGVNDLVTIGSMKTTPGRLLLAAAVPDQLRKTILTDHSFTFDRKGLDTVFTSLAKEHSKDFGLWANRLKDMGNGATYGAVKVPHPQLVGASAVAAAEKGKFQYIPVPTHSLSLDDFTPDTQSRDKVLQQAQRTVNKIYSNKRLSPNEQDRRAVEVWRLATNKMVEQHQTKMKKNPTNLHLMLQAGVKPSLTQYQQMVLAPMVVSGPGDQPVPQPVKRSYSEGLDLSGYWTQMHGARRGSVMKVQEVRDPGAFSKQLINTTMGLVVAAPDCGTQRGVALSAMSSDALDRVLASDISVKGMTFRSGQILTPDILGKIRAADKNAQVLVRSPLKCEHDKGLCQKCYGLAPNGQFYPTGTNAGVLAAQSLGERAVQLTLKSFHSGGVQSAGKSLLNAFNRIQQLTLLPEKLPASAMVAKQSGRIDKIEEDATGVRIWIGGKEHHVGKDTTGNPLHKPLNNWKKIPDYRSWQPPRVGQRVEAGQLLSDPNRTVVNPRDLYRATGKIEKVQNYLTEELYNVYKNEGVRKPHVETVVKAMSNLTKVRDPGDSRGILKGEYQPLSKLQALNAQLVKQGKRPVKHSPVLAGVNVLPQRVYEDWMAKLNHERLSSTIMEAASTGAVSNLHGMHPIPGAAYGAEFGLTSRHSHRKPEWGKLKDVPVHNY